MLIIARKEGMEPPPSFCAERVTLASSLLHDTSDGRAADEIGCWPHADANTAAAATDRWLLLRPILSRRFVVAQIYLLAVGCADPTTLAAAHVDLRVVQSGRFVLDSDRNYCRRCFDGTGGSKGLKYATHVEGNFLHFLSKKRVLRFLRC